MAHRTVAGNAVRVVPRSEKLEGYVFVEADSSGKSPDSHGGTGTAVSVPRDTETLQGAGGTAQASPSASRQQLKSDRLPGHSRIKVMTPNPKRHGTLHTSINISGKPSTRSNSL